MSRIQFFPRLLRGRNGERILMKDFRDAREDNYPLPAIPLRPAAQRTSERILRVAH